MIRTVAARKDFSFEPSSCVKVPSSMFHPNHRESDPTLKNKLKSIRDQLNDVINEIDENGTGTETKLKTQLKITGGFGGPATWQDFTVDHERVSPEVIAAITNKIGTLQTNLKIRKPSAPFPDSRTYTIEYGDEENPRKIVLNDADLDAEAQNVINLIRQHASGDERGQEKDKEIR